MPDGDRVSANNPAVASAASPSRARRPSTGKLCGAKLRKRDAHCRMSAMPNGRCRLHGGLSTGPKTWTAGGRYSKGLGKLASRLQELLEDAALLDLRPTLGLMDLATEMRLKRGLADGDTPGWRVECKRLLMVFAAACTEEGDTISGAAVPAMRDLAAHIDRGVAADEAVADAVEIANTRSVRTEKALGIELAQEHVSTERQILAYLAVFMGTIQQHVPPEVFVRAATAADRSVLQAGHGAVARYRVGEAAPDDGVPAGSDRLLPSRVGLVPVE